METVFGLKGKDFAMIAADTVLARNIYLISDKHSKIRPLSKHCMIGVIGNLFDVNAFTQFVATRVSLYEITHGYPISKTAVMHIARHHLLSNLANKVKFMVAMLIAAYDAEMGGTLCFIDAKGTTQYVNYCGHGIGQAISMGISSVLWKPNLTIQDGQDILRKCIREIQSRLIVNLRYFEIFVVDKDGVRKLESYEGIRLPGHRLLQFGGAR